jgi:hypothetical protein
MMITLTLTAEYNEVTETWEVLLPNGVDPDAVVLVSATPDADEDTPPTWTDDELDELLKKPDEPKSGKELVTMLEMQGGWEDLEITDGATWSIETRKKIDGRYKW